MQKIFSSIEYRILGFIFLFLLPILAAATFFIDNSMAYFVYHIGFFICLSFVSLFFLYFQQNKRATFGFFLAVPIFAVLYLVLFLTKQASEELLFSGFDPKFFRWSYTLLFALFLYLSPSLYILLRTVRFSAFKSLMLTILCVGVLLAGNIAYISIQKERLSKQENWQNVTSCGFTIKASPKIKPGSTGQNSAGCRNIFMWSNSGDITIDVYETYNSHSLSEWINNEWVRSPKWTSFSPYGVLLGEEGYRLYFAQNKAGWTEFFNAQLKNLLSDKKDRMVSGELAYQFRDVPFNNETAFSLFTYHNGKIVKIYCRYGDEELKNTCNEIIDSLVWTK